MIWGKINTMTILGFGICFFFTSVLRILWFAVQGQICVCNLEVSETIHAQLYGVIFSSQSLQSLWYWLVPFSLQSEGVCFSYLALLCDSENACISLGSSGRAEREKGKWVGGVAPHFWNYSSTNWRGRLPFPGIALHFLSCWGPRVHRIA